MDVRIRNVFRYVVPAVSSMIVTFAYVVVDGMFVGRGVGANALAAVNIALPFNVLVTAVGTLLTIGGATVFAIRTGRGDSGGASEVFLTSGLLVVIASVALAVIGVACPETIATVSGANAVLLESTATYIRYYSMFAIAISASLWLSAFIRNDGRPGLAFWGMVSGALANVFLDWLFVFPLQMGIKGAAIASGLGQILSLAILSTHLIGNRGVLRLRAFKPSPPLMGKVVARGTPELITQLYHPLTVLCYNLVVIKVAGEEAIAAFSIITYIASLFIGIFTGVSQGIQPLLGQSFGSGKKRDLSFYFRAGLIINLSLSVFLYFGMVIGGQWVYALFSSDAELIRMAEFIWKCNAPAFVLASVNIVFTTFFFSTKQTGNATIVAASRGLLLNSICIFAFSYLVDAKYVWFAIVLSEIITIALAVWLKNREALRPVGDIRTVPAIVIGSNPKTSTRVLRAVQEKM